DLNKFSQVLCSRFQILGIDGRFLATTRELQETGFSPKSATVTKYLAKTRFLATCQQLTINKKKMLPLHRGQLLQ
ncbi:MAG TPA: hypothetical protein DGO89_07125, partial [Microcoleaceae bacterium UBA9251]|nr:hypothetical protein [Microcoleaceae cyanobacterium UBA9251]